MHKRQNHQLLGISKLIYNEKYIILAEEQTGSIFFGEYNRIIPPC